MPLTHSSQYTQEEPRYDAETLRKVTALAQRLQARKQETVTAREMEEIGAELGLERSVVRQALDQVTATGTAAVRQVKRLNPRQLEALTAAWWAAGWCLPFALSSVLDTIGLANLGGMGFFLGWGVYIGGGILISAQCEENKAGKKSGKNPPQVREQELSRAELLDALFTLQHALEGQKQHRAFLSVDVAGSSAMKRGESDLAVEYSFGQLQAWIGDTVRAYGGELHSAAGDGMMCVFQDDVAALRAARALQEGIEHFNRGRNRLSTPFQLRCGISAGEVAIDPGAGVGSIHSVIIDRAANLQKQAQPGDIVVGSELAVPGLTELGGLAPIPSGNGADPAFSWLAARR